MDNVCDQEVGRFLSEDPLEAAGGDANLYAYVGNVPNVIANGNWFVSGWRLSTQQLANVVTHGGLKMTEEPPALSVQMSNDEGFVLFDWLKSDLVELKRQEDRALDIVLSNVEAQLERSLAVVVDPNYARLLKQATKRLLDQA